MLPRKRKNRRTGNRWTILVATLLLVVVSGCEPVAILDYPLSDATNSRPDAELFGYWKQVDLDDESDSHPVPMTIGKSDTNPRLLQAAGMELDERRRVHIRRVTLMTTVQVDDKSGKTLRFVTLTAKEIDEEEKAEGYLLLHYEIQAGQRLKIYLMNSLAIAKAIETGQLKGVAKRNKQPPGITKNKYEEIRITAGPAELRAFLKKTGNACFEKKQGLEFQRIVTD